MTSGKTSVDATQQYLHQIHHELRFARKRDRDDYLAQIAEHLRESREPHDSSDVETLSELQSRVGAPRDLAREFYAAERTRLNLVQRILLRVRRWWIAALVGAVVIGGVSAVRWAATYQPLSLHLAGGYQDTVIALSGKAPVKLSEGAFQPVTWKLTEGRYRVTIVFAATNTNGLAVSISPPPIVQGFPNPVSWRLQAIRTLTESPFLSARVDGHWYREIVFTTTYTCVPWSKGSPNAAGGETTYATQLPVEMSFMGFQRVVELPIQPFYLEFVGDCFKVTTPPTSVGG